MNGWLQKIKTGTDFTVRKDPFGYAIEKKPRFPLQKWFEKMVGRVSVPEDQQRALEDLAKRGAVIFAVKYNSQFDFVYVSQRLEQLSLPHPSFAFDMHPYFWQPRWYAIKTLIYHFYHLIRRGALPDPYQGNYYKQKIDAGETGILSLLGKKGYWQSTVLFGNDPIEHLIEIQKQTEKPIFIVPLVLLYTRHPEGARRGPLEILLGQRERTSSIRKLISFVSGNPNAVMETGEPLNLREIVPELAEDSYQRRKQIFQLRRGLIDSVDNIKRAIVGPILKSKLELKEIILHHPRLETFMQRRARSTSQEMWKIRMEADGYLDEIAANYSIGLIQVASRFMTWVWNNLYDGIEVDSEGLQRVKRAARNKTLVYIPCHKSHMDYLILSYVLYVNNLYTPFIAAGKNLSFWPLGAFFRRCGAFFIRRSFKGLKYYAEVFSLYVKTMVQLGHNIEFFIEGGRSRTGKMVLPKLGLLAILIQAVEEGFCKDLVFVPTAICYDRIPEEESYLNEIAGGTKTEENLGQLMRARRFLRKRYGRVYVQFAEPVSLQRYLERYPRNLQEMLPKERHAMYRDFAYRIINNINQASLVTPHALAASVLLASSKRGASKAEFNEVAWIFKEYLSRHEVGFSKTLKSFDAGMEDALRDLERSKMIGKLKDEDDDLEEEVFTMEDSKRLTLEYYKNNIIHFFLPAAYVSTSILAQQTFRFSVKQIVEDAAFMKNFFKFEFVFDNELSDQELVGDVLDIFEKMGCLHLVGEGDQPYVLAHKGLEAAYAFHGLLRNYFEAYWLVLRGFRYLQKKNFEEKDFTKKILSMGQKALKLELVERPECVSKIIYENALKFYIENSVVLKTVNGDGNGKEAELCAAPESRPLIQFYSKQISRFLRSPHFALQ